MLSINLGLTCDENYACVVGFSGKIINKEDLLKRRKSNTKFLLMHGDLDEIVSPDDLAKTVNEKAKDLATMGHPSYTMTKELFIAEPLKKINQAIVDLHSNS